MPATYAQLESALRLIASGIRPDLRSKVRAKVMTRQELVGIARAALGVRGIAGAAAVAPPAGLYWQAPARQDAEA